MGERVHVGSLSDLPPGSVHLLQAGARPLAIFRLGDTLVAIDDRCPHRAGPLSEGTLSGLEVTCPWHGSRFQLTDGRVLCGPAVRGLTRYSVVVENGAVWVELP